MHDEVTVWMARQGTVWQLPGICLISAVGTLIMQNEIEFAPCFCLSARATNQSFQM